MSSATKPIFTWVNTQNKSPRWPAKKSSPLRTAPQPQYILGAMLPLPHTLQDGVKSGVNQLYLFGYFCQCSLSWTIKIDGQPRWVYTTIPARETLNQSIGENINVLIKRLNYSHQPLVLSRTLIPFLTSEQLLSSNLRDTQQLFSVSGVLKHSAQSLGETIWEPAILLPPTHTHTHTHARDWFQLKLTTSSPHTHTHITIFFPFKIINTHTHIDFYVPSTISNALNISTDV